MITQEQCNQYERKKILSVTPVSSNPTTRKKYVYQTSLEIIDLDKEREYDLMRGKGMIVEKRQDIKKDLKSDKSIFSSFFGPTLNDHDAFANRYRCKCNHLNGKLHQGEVCIYCHTPVQFMSDDFEKFGWICIDEKYGLIHPNLFKALSAFIGAKEFDSIIDNDDKIDVDGKPIENKVSKTSPFVGIGILEFRDRFDEIMEFYRNKHAKKPEKIEYYDHIMKNKDKVFCHSIPVYTTQLRPFNLDDSQFNFDGNNSLYNILAAQATRVNRNQLVSRCKGKPSKQILYRMQTKWMEIYADLEKQLSHKKGLVRSTIGGRYNFCARSVIVPKSELEIDQVILPYSSMVELLEFRIVNILSKTMPMHLAYQKWFMATIYPSREIYDIMMKIVQSEYVGVLINRNPSIWSLSVLQMQVVGIHFDSHAMSLPLEILSGLNADFDGDTLNCMYIINMEFLEACRKVFNPRYVGQISRNTGLFETNVSLQTNNLICLNSFVNLAMDSYTDEDLDDIQSCLDLEPKVTVVSILPEVAQAANAMK